MVDKDIANWEIKIDEKKMNCNKLLIICNEEIH